MHPNVPTQVLATGSARLIQGQGGPPPAMAIPGHIDTLAITAEAVHKACEELHDRLAPVLGVLNIDDNELQAVRPVVSPVAGQLLDVGDSLHALERRLRDLIARVEL